MDNLNKVDERIRQKLLYETYKDMTEEQKISRVSNVDIFMKDLQ